MGERLIKIALVLLAGWGLYLASRPESLRSFRWVRIVVSLPLVAAIVGVAFDTIRGNARMALLEIEIILNNPQIMPAQVEVANAARQQVLRHLEQRVDAKKSV